jgi:hypothetical protein
MATTQRTRSTSKKANPAIANAIPAELLNQLDNDEMPTEQPTDKVEAAPQQPAMQEKTDQQKADDQADQPQQEKQDDNAPSQAADSEATGQASNEATTEEIGDPETPTGTEPSNTSELRSKEDEEKDNAKLISQVSDGAMTKALKQAFGFGRKALHLEIAVALANFAADGSFKPNLATKKHIMRQYGDAGFEIATDGEDYKTINRRINAAADLYETIGRPAVYEAMGGKNDMEAIASLVDFLIKEYNFKGINSVLRAAGKEVKQTNTAEYRASRTDQKPAQAQEPQAAAEGTSTKAGGEPGAAQPQGHVAAGGTNEQGQPLTADGTIDKRVKTEDAPSLATQEARGEISKEDADAQSGKQPEEPKQEQPKGSAEDQATAQRMAESMQDRRKDRRATDSPDAIVFTTDHIHVALPHHISKQEVMHLVQQLLAFASEMDDDEEAAKQKHSLAAIQRMKTGGKERRQAAHH